MGHFSVINFWRPKLVFGQWWNKQWCICGRYLLRSGQNQQMELRKWEWLELRDVPSKKTSCKKILTNVFFWIRSDRRKNYQFIWKTQSSILGSIAGVFISTMTDDRFGKMLWMSRRDESLSVQTVALSYFVFFRIVPTTLQTVSRNPICQEINHVLVITGGMETHCCTTVAAVASSWFFTAITVGKYSCIRSAYLHSRAW